MAITDETTDGGLVVNTHEAKTHLSKLLNRAASGERIIIAKAGKPIAVLIPYTPKRKRRPLGMDDGKVFIHDDWDDPLPEFEEYM